MEWIDEYYAIMLVKAENYTGETKYFYNLESGVYEPETYDVFNNLEDIIEAYESVLGLKDTGKIVKLQVTTKVIEI